MYKPVEDMPFSKLRAQYKSLAKQLQPINARRKEILDEIRTRENKRDAVNRVKVLSPSQKRGMLEELKKEFGEE